MGRRKIHKKYRQKYTLQVKVEDSTSDMTNLTSTYKDVESTNSHDDLTSNKMKNINDFQHRTPEFVMQGYSKIMEYYEDMSPKINLRIPKFKLNFDIPENDDVEADDVEIQKKRTAKAKESKEFVKDLEKTLSVEKVFENDNEEIESVKKECNFTNFHSMTVKSSSELVDVPNKEITSLSGYFQIPSSSFNMASAFIEPGSSNFTFIGGPMRSDSLNNSTTVININDYNKQNPKTEINNNCKGNLLKEDYKYLDKVGNDNCIKMEPEEKLEGLTATKRVSSLYSLGNVTHLDLPAVSDIDSKTSTESQVAMLNNASEVQTVSPSKKSVKYFRRLKNSLTKITTFCSWLAGKFIIWIKKGYKRVRNLLSIVIRTANQPVLTRNELTQVIAVIKCENDRVLCIFSEKISLLSHKLIEIRLKNEAALSALANEIKGMQTANIQLVETNNNLTKELQILQEKICEINKTSASEPIGATPGALLRFAPSSGCALVQPTPAPPPALPVVALRCPPPPPPPPLPRKSGTQTTPNRLRSTRLSNRTPTRKCSTPLSSRPAITVEDLLKVTLKKAPQSFKENRRNTIPGPRGPVISLDMLRNVKLKSARRRSLDQHKSPRSASRIMKNRSQANVSLSPIMLGVEGSLSRLLKPVDPHKRVFKRIQSTASNSETDLLKETSKTKFTDDSCRSESGLI